MIQKLLLIFFVVSAMSIGKADGQEVELYLANIKGRVVSIDDQTPVSYAHIINQRVRGGTTTNADGNFAIQIFTEDTLIIKSMGFIDYKFYLTEFPPQDFYLIKMVPVRHMLGEVTVTEKNRLKESLGLPESKNLDIPIEFRGEAFNEKPTVWNAILNPVSYAQYFLSDKEKRKRSMLQIISDDKQWNTFAIYHNLVTIKKLTGLDGDEADDFMIYCNINNRLPYTASQLEIEFQIMDLYFKYKKEKGL